MTQSSNVYHETLSGVCASLISSTITYPLDLVKTRLQADLSSVGSGSIPSIVRDIVVKDGVSGLFVGIYSEYLKVVVQNSLYFSTYSSLKSKFDDKPISALESLLVGVLAGTATQLVVNPISVIQTRLQTSGAHHANNSVLGAVGKILSNEGLLAFYRGITPALILTLNPAIQFMVYDKLKSWWMRIRRKQLGNVEDFHLTAMESFLIGAISKVVATVITYPYIMAKTRMQYASNSDQGVNEVLIRVLRNNGFQSIYKGMQAQIIKSALSTALMFMFKDSIHRRIVTIINRLSGSSKS
uniref:Uncharacterized protein n=1 Tax=Spongospora subterranea TaxID=70186 RepID=A0A0H5QUG6_9EUKA|eukprot:CRZ05550.1 hypothetical protein [Spongospora subterranea]